MIENKRKGSIVNVSSQSSMIGLKDHAAYSSSKGALDTLTKVMALELGPFGVCVLYLYGFYLKSIQLFNNNEEIVYQGQRNFCLLGT